MDIKTILSYLSEHHCKLNKKEVGKKETDIIEDPNYEEYYYQKDHQHIEILVFISNNNNSNLKIELIMNDLYHDNYLLTLSNLDGVHNAEFYIKTVEDLKVIVECINRYKKIIKIILKTENKIKRIIDG